MRLPTLLSSRSELLEWFSRAAFCFSSASFRRLLACWIYSQLSTEHWEEQQVCMTGNSQRLICKDVQARGAYILCSVEDSPQMLVNGRVTMSWKGVTPSMSEWLWRCINCRKLYFYPPSYYCSRPLLLLICRDNFCCQLFVSNMSFSASSVVFLCHSRTEAQSHRALSSHNTKTAFAWWNLCKLWI